MHIASVTSGYLGRCKCSHIANTAVDHRALWYLPKNDVYFGIILGI